MIDNGFVFNSVVLREESGFVSLCLDLDVASQGDTVQQARESLLEAVTLYLETALESNLPWLRPVPPGKDPRFVGPQNVVAEFPLNVSYSLTVTHI